MKNIVSNKSDKTQKITEKLISIDVAIWKLLCQFNICVNHFLALSFKFPLLIAISCLVITAYFSLNPYLSYYCYFMCNQNLQACQLQFKPLLGCFAVEICNVVIQDQLYRFRLSRGLASIWRLHFKISIHIFSVKFQIYF